MKSSDAANSTLWAVLDNTTRESFPASCPIVSESEHGIDTVSADARTAIKAWIDAGAANN